MWQIITQFAIISVLFQTRFQCIKGNMIASMIDRFKSEMHSESDNDHFLDHEFVKIHDSDGATADASLNLPRVRRQGRNNPSAYSYSFYGDDSRYGRTIYSLGEGSKVNYLNLYNNNS